MIRKWISCFAERNGLLPLNSAFFGLCCLKKKKKITSSHSGKMQSLPVPLFPTLNLPSTNPSCHHTLLGQIPPIYMFLGKVVPSVALQGRQCCSPCPACAPAGAGDRLPDQRLWSDDTSMWTPGAPSTGSSQPSLFS